MIKKVRITEIHPKDVPFYSKFTKKVIGQVVTVEIDDEAPPENGWTVIKSNKDLLAMEKGNVSGFPFHGIKYEEVA